MVGVKSLTKEELGKKLLPNKIGKMNFKNQLEITFRKINFDNLHFELITMIFAISLLISTLIFVLIYPYLYLQFTNFFYNPFWKILIMFSTFFLIELIIYYFSLFVYLFSLDGKMKKKEHEIEKDLPEFLDDLVSNIKGGLPLERALLKSCQKEQKALLSEISLVNQKIMMGSTSEIALTEFSQRYDSQILKRTFFLITEGLRFGGNIIQPLTRISENLKQIYNLDEEIKANAGGFSVVIKGIALFIAPILFSLALTLLTFIGRLFKLMQKSNVDSISFSTIPQEYSTYLVIFSYAMIVLITFFSSLITAELKGEKIYTSIKYLPIYLLIGIVLFNLVSKVLLSFFGSII